MVAGSDVPSDASGEPMRVVVADNDAGVTELVRAILTDEGYDVTVLDDTERDSVVAAIGRLEPDCVLLDGAHGSSFGHSWTTAAYLASRDRPVP